MASSLGKNTGAISVAEELKVFKFRENCFSRYREEKESAHEFIAAVGGPRNGGEEKRSPETQEQKFGGSQDGQPDNGVPSLAQMCLQQIADDFADRPVLFEVPTDQITTLTRLLPEDLDIAVAASYVTDENYWKRRCETQTHWRNQNIARHGMMWKQMFFERYLQEQLEQYNPATDDFDPLHKLIRAAGDHVFRLELKQLLSHMDLTLLFESLHNLTQFRLSYGVRQIGMKYERSLFGIKISDAMSLAGCVKTTQVLASLSLPCNHMDDDLLRMLMTGLASNNTITHLDLSHNLITNHGARLLAKLLGPASVLTSLDLCDNQIHRDGGRFLGRALRGNSSLMELNLRLNRLTDLGGKSIFDGLRDNATLTTLNVSSNSLSSESIKTLGAVLANTSCALTIVDFSCNEAVESDCATLLSMVEHNTVLMSLDMRRNRVEDFNVHGEGLQKIARRNELRSKPRMPT